MPPRRSSPVRRAAAAAAALLAAVAGAAALLWAVLPSAEGVGARVPRSTALIEQRRAEARRAGRPFRADLRPVPLERISPRLAEAVVASEDASFFGHGPFDFREIQKAVGESVERRRLGRGASTLTQQLAKNLWFGTERSLLRKAKEAVLAVKLERALPKRRILWLYLNVVEWGDGVFGAEAAARARFGTSAAALTTAQAAVLAALLPAPRRCDLANPSTWLRRRARRVTDLLLASGHISAEEHAHASAELERILAGPRPLRDEDEPPEEEEPEATPPPLPTAGAVPPPTAAASADSPRGASPTAGAPAAPPLPATPIEPP